jgi:hypothetical protein
VMTRLELRELAKDLADMRNSQFVSDPEWNVYLNTFYKEVYEALVTSNEDYFTKSTSFSLGLTNQQAAPSDFFKARSLETQVSGQVYEPLPYLPFEERMKASRLSYRIINGFIVIFPEEEAQNRSYRLWYIPKVTPLTSDTQSTVDLLGFDELIAIRAANIALAKQESPNQGLLKIEAELQSRLKTMTLYQSTDAVTISRAR